MKSTSPVLFVSLVVMLLLGMYALSTPVQAQSTGQSTAQSQSAPAAPRTTTTVRYVAPGGNDMGGANNCLTQSSPCATIQQAVNQSVGTSATVSDTIQLAEGSYSGNVSIPSKKYLIVQGYAGKQATTTINGTITMSGSQLGLNNVTVTGSGTNGGGLFISTPATTTVFVRNAIFTGNSATNGGAIYNNGTLTVLRSTFQNNTAAGAALYNASGATAVISQTAVVTNTGDAIVNAGTLAMVNTTVGANSANGVTNSGTSATLGLYNVTVANNAGTGVNIASGSATIENSIMAGNSTSDCTGAGVTGTYNLLGTVGCSLSGGTNLTGSPNLAPLALNHGPNMNYMPQTGSPAIDAGDPLGCKDGQGQQLTSDQRSAIRPQGSACDIGSDETGNAPLLLTISPDTVTAGTGDFTLTLTGVDFPTTQCWVLFNNVSRTASCNGSGTATAPISNTEILSPGTVDVVLQKGPLSANIYSNPLQFTIAPNGSLRYIYLPLIMR